MEYLEGKLEALDGEELMKIKDNINCLFQHCIQALGEEHPIRVVNALQVPRWEIGNTLFCFWWGNIFTAGIKHLVFISLLLRRSAIYRAVATYCWWRLQTFIVCSLWRTVACFRIQEDVVMQDQVGGNGRTRGACSLQAASLGAQEYSSFVCILLLPILPYFSLLFELPYGLKMK